MPLQATSGAASYDAFGGGGGAPAAGPQYIEDVFSTYLYTGNGVTYDTVVNDIDLSGKGGLVWNKSRSAVESNFLEDTVRGVGNNICSNLTDAQNTGGVVGQFNNNGFTVFGTTSVTYASWTFRKQPKFFDFVTYTGTGSNTTIAHSLGSVPACIIVKRTDTAADWAVYHTSLANTEYLVLNTTAAADTGATWWNSTTPTSAVFSVGTDASVNASGGTYVAYIFAHDSGGFGLLGTDNVISCGSYTGNGSATGPVNTLGYEPQWVMIKRTDTTGNWTIFDNMRGMPVSSADAYLYANSSAAEASLELISPTATGFSITSSVAGINASGGNYIYMAIRRGPMKVPTSGTSVFTPESRTGAGSATYFATGPTPTDLFYTKRTNGAGSSAPGFFWSRLQGKNGMSPTSTAVESATYAVLGFDAPNNTGTRVGNTNNYWDTTTEPYVNYSFQRAPNFFDVVCYKGIGTATTVSHNLGVVPELIFVKRRETISAWESYSSGLANTEYLVLNTTAALATGATRWDSTTPTSSVFSVGTSNTTNASAGTFVAYLFATCTGVSKVGSYTGTGTLTTINCGFTGGARFVLIKRTDSTSNWFVWDTSRGMVTSADFALYLNSNAAESNADSVYTTTTGFELLASPVEDVNTSSGTYIFLAIA